MLQTNKDFGKNVNFHIIKIGTAPSYLQGLTITNMFKEIFHRNTQWSIREKLYSERYFSWIKQNRHKHLCKQLDCLINRTNFRIKVRCHCHIIKYIFLYPKINSFVYLCLSKSLVPKLQCNSFCIKMLRYHCNLDLQSMTL